MGREEYYYATSDTIRVQDTVTTQPFDGRYHFHDNYEIYLFLSGDADLYIEENRYRLQRGHLFVLSDKEIHRVSVRGAAPYRRITVHFDHRVVAALNTPATNLFACFLDHRPGEGNALALAEDQFRDLDAILGKMAATSTRYGADVLAAVYLAELLVHINGLFIQSKSYAPTRPSGIIAEVIQYIGSNLDRRLTLDTIAAQFLLDKFYLSHLFRRETGDGLHQYMLIKKVSIAKRYLSEGRSVAETCELAGFNDYNNFIRTFKKIAGTTPGKYLNRAS